MADEEVTALSPGRRCLRREAPAVEEARRKSRRGGFDGKYRLYLRILDGKGIAVVPVGGGVHSRFAGETECVGLGGEVDKQRQREKMWTQKQALARTAYRLPTQTSSRGR
jgi:hypothetical protein